MSHGNWLEVDGNYHERTTTRIHRNGGVLHGVLHNNQSWWPTDQPKVRNDKKCIELTLLFRCARFYTIATFSLFAFIRRHRFKKCTKPLLLKSFYFKSYVQKSYLIFRNKSSSKEQNNIIAQHRSLYHSNKLGKRESEEREWVWTCKCWFLYRISMKSHLQD